MSTFGRSTARRIRRNRVRRAQLETLEPRLLLAVSAEEQYFVYRLNRARHDPRAYEVEAGLPISLSGVAPRQPLALNSALDSSAQFKAEEMANYNYFAHRSSVTGTWPNKLIRDHGYPLPPTLNVGGTNYVFPDGGNSVESLAAGYSTAADAVDELIIDEGVNPPGHRYHLLSMNGPYVVANEIGVGHHYRGDSTYRNYWAIHITAADIDRTFLTGVVHADSNSNQRYDIGEGLGNVTVTAGGQSTTTNAAGGWSLPISPGEYLVTASGGSFSGQSIVPVVVDGENVEVDFISGLDTGYVNFDLWQNTAPTLDTSGTTTFSPVVRDTANPPGTTVAALAGDLVTDPDPAALLGIAVTQTSGSVAGSWQYSTDNGDSWNNLGVVSTSAARLLQAADLLRFVPAAGVTGAAILQFAAWDQTEGQPGGIGNVASASGATTAFSAAVESATLTVITANTAPVLNDAATPSLPAVLEDAAEPNGTRVVDLLGSAVSDPDPGAMAGIAAVGSQGIDGQWQYLLAGSSTWQPMGSVSTGSARLLRGEDRVRFVPAADANGSAALRFHAWDQMTGRAGQLANLGDGIGGSTAYSVASNTAAVSVIGVNDAPVLDTSQQLFMSPVAVNQTFSFNGGDTVAELLGDAISDVDDGALEGIAVTGVSSNGTMWFRNDGSWSAGTTSPNFAWLLKPTDKLQFVPNSGFSGTATVTFHAWDQTTGPETSGRWANLSSADRLGGTTAYSAASTTANILVGDAGQPPRVTEVARLDPSPTSATSVRYRVAFSEDVVNVDATDFRLMTSGTATGSFASVVKDNSHYVVTIDQVTGSGTLELAFATSALNIRDAQGNLLDMTGFSGSPVYTVEQTPPTISISDVTVNEGDTGSVDAVFTVSLSKASGSTVSVSYATSEGTASANVDFTSTNGQLSIPAGVTTRTITVQVTGDADEEADETFFVTLNDAVGATLDDAQGKGTILDDDDPPPQPSDGEFLVNTYTPSNQDSAHVASNSDGFTVVVWTSQGQNGETVGVYGQRYQANGERLGSEFQVNSTALGEVGEPRVGVADDGSFVVVWPARNLPGGSGWDVYGRRFAADGSQLKAEFRLHDAVVGIQEDAEIAMAADGRFVVSWEGDDGVTQGSHRDVFARRFNASAEPQGAPFRVNTTTAQHQQNAHVAIAANGRFVVAWKSYLQDGSDEGVFARTFSWDLQTASNEIAATQTTADQQRDPVVASDADGNFVVSWISHNQGGYFFNIYARQFAANGSALGDEFRVNTNLVEGQAGPTEPTIAMRDDGSFAMAWTTPYQDGSSLGVYGQLFDADAAPVGDEFAVNVTTEGRQSRPQAAIDERGLLTVVWRNADASGLDRDVFGRQFATVPVDRLEVTVNASSIAENAGAGAATITVTRHAADISGELAVNLQNSDTSEASFPTSVTIPAGQSQVTVTLDAVDDALLDGTQQLTITALASGFVADELQLNVTDHETLTLSANRDTFAENDGAGAVTLTVRRGNTDTGSPLVVTLQNGDTSEAALPTSVTIPAGQAETTVTLDAVDDDLLDGTQQLTVTAEAPGYVSVEIELNATDDESLAPWQNPRNRFNVNDDRVVAASDVLVLINDINSRGARSLDPPIPDSGSPPPFLDVNGDNQLAPSDVLAVINYLNSGGGQPGESEGPDAFLSTTKTGAAPRLFESSFRARQAQLVAEHVDAVLSVDEGFDPRRRRPEARRPAPAG